MSAAAMPATAATGSVEAALCLPAEAGASTDSQSTAAGSAPFGEVLAQAGSERQDAALTTPSALLTLIAGPQLLALHSSPTAAQPVAESAADALTATLLAGVDAESLTDAIQSGPQGASAGRAPRAAMDGEPADAGDASLSPLLAWLMHMSLPPLAQPAVAAADTAEAVVVVAQAPIDVAASGLGGFALTAATTLAAAIARRSVTDPQFTQLTGDGDGLAVALATDAFTATPDEQSASLLAIALPALGLPEALAPRPDGARGREPSSHGSAATAGGAAASTAPAAAAPAAAVSPTRTIAVPVAHPRWIEAVAHEVRWFVGHEVQSATLRLSPLHLGPVEVRIALSDSQVNVSFGAAHADTRAALDQSLPRLRELLTGAGLSLGEVSVQAEARRGSQNQFANGRSNAAAPADEVQVSARISLGLVDEYA